MNLLHFSQSVACSAVNPTQLKGAGYIPLSQPGSEKAGSASISFIRHACRLSPCTKILMLVL